MAEDDVIFRSIIIEDKSGGKVLCTERDTNR